MADSNITKRALAAALKELMEHMSFSQITISDICGKCDMSRKSFYYHFKDKYDLINWIFDTEFLSTANMNPCRRKVDLLLDLCEYFYINHKFYRNALQVRGQNSFLEHFHELIYTTATERLGTVFEKTKMPELSANFLADSFTCAFVRWMMERDPTPPEEFIDSLMFFSMEVSTYIYQLIKMRQEEHTPILLKDR